VLAVLVINLRIPELDIVEREKKCQFHISIHVSSQTLASLQGWGDYCHSSHSGSLTRWAINIINSYKMCISATLVGAE